MARRRDRASVVEEATRRSAGAGRRVQLGPDQIVRTEWETDRAILVGLARDHGRVAIEEESLDELSALAATAGAETVERFLQVREAPHAATYVGRGKIEAIRAAADLHDATLVVFDDELAPAQQRNLEEALGGRRVLDRTQLILDIFAMHATTAEGKVQTELAQLHYRLPRLRGRGAYLSRLGAGIGTRGPGETVLEVDRRRIGERIKRLSGQLAELDRTRMTKRKGRRASGLAQWSLVGYTNAGKSTLLNQLTDAGVLVEDKLFSTLDTTVRRLELPGARRVLVSDTVGLVAKLPHDLVRAFHSTLEEVAEADLVVHVVDASGADPMGHVEVTREVLRDVGAQDVAEVVVWNKVDRADPGTVGHLLATVPGSVAISASTGEGVDKFLEAAWARQNAAHPVVDLEIPYADAGVLARLRAAGEVLQEEHGSAGSRVRVRLEPAEAYRWSTYLVGDDVSEDLA
ncbi:MAG: GTPase HflX [Acidimicrobiia bacterium]